MNSIVMCNCPVIPFISHTFSYGDDDPYFPVDGSQPRTRATSGGGGGEGSGYLLQPPPSEVSSLRPSTTGGIPNISVTQTVQANLRK